MTITKHGNKWYCYYFRCPNCGCEWTADKREVHQETITDDDRVEKVMSCNCPEFEYDANAINFKMIYKRV